MSTIRESENETRWCIVCGKQLSGNKKYFCSVACAKQAKKRKMPSTMQLTPPKEKTTPKLSLTDAAKLSKKYNCTYGQLMYKIYRGEVTLDD